MRYAVARSVAWVLALAALGSSAHAVDGLAVDRDAPWPRWQARLSIHTDALAWRNEVGDGASAGLRLRSLGVMGDYYFLSAPFSERSSGGFRATSGVLLGQASGAWALPAGGAANVGRRHAGAPGSAEAALDGTVPYAGVGYSALSLSGGWGFSADLGLMAVGSRVRLGQAAGATQRLDDVVRDLRLMPVLQLGVSYSF